MPTLREFAAEALARDAAREAIEFERRWMTWGDLKRIADRVADFLTESGVAADAPVVLIPRNRPSSVAAFLALLADGRTVRMIYAFQSPEGIARDIKRLAPAALIADGDDFSADMRAALKDEGIAALRLEKLDARAEPGFERAGAAKDRRGPKAPLIEILTSGTTGPPKQFALTHEMIAKDVVAPRAPQGDPATMAPFLLFFPLGNISGIYSTLPTLLHGQRALLLERFSIEAWRDHVVRYRPAHSGLPPSFVQAVLDADIPKADLSSIKALGTGAAPLDPTVQKAFEEKYGIPIILSYGATEFGGPVAAMTPELHAQWGKAKHGTVGRAFAGAELRVVDPQTGAVLPPGAEGVLEVIAPRIGPNWIRTSDIAVIDEDGFMFHRGRADGAIMRGGFKVLPETIERALMLHPDIAEAAVVGVEDRRLGQVPAAAVRLKPGAAPLTIEAVDAHLRRHVLATHIPVHWRFCDDLPRTPSLKVDRPALRRLFAAA